MHPRPTPVTVDKSIEEIRKFLLKMGAVGFSFGSLEDRAYLVFSFEGKGVRMVLEVPKHPGPEATIAQVKKYELIRRKRWRQIVICIKAKFQSVHSNLETFDQAFLAHLLTKDGVLIGETLKETIAEFSKRDLNKLLGFRKKKTA